MCSVDRYTTWGCVSQKQVSRAWISNYIPQILWDVITCACSRYQLLAHKSSYVPIHGWYGVSLWVNICCRAANRYGISVFCTEFTCKIREYEFGLQNTEIELCQFCHIKYCCQNKAYLFWVANQSRFVAFYALIFHVVVTRFLASLPVPVVLKESTRVSTGSGWVPPE